MLIFTCLAIERSVSLSALDNIVVSEIDGGSEHLENDGKILKIKSRAIEAYHVDADYPCCMIGTYSICTLLYIINIYTYIYIDYTVIYTSRSAHRKFHELWTF